jgi:hypothetical protein
MVSRYRARYLKWKDRVAEAGKLVSQSPPPHQQVLVAQPQVTGVQPTLERRISGL